MKIIGHRGARGLAPENTMAAFRKGIEHAVDGIECDLRVTKDSVVVLHHDKNISDADGQKHLIKKCTFAQLKERKPDLTTLSELLEDNQVKDLYLEVKPRERVQPIIKLLGARSRKQIHLGSKKQNILLDLHKALPDIPKFVIHAWSGTIATHRANQVDTKLLFMNKIWLWRGFIAPMAKRGWQLSAYTLNDPKKAAKWQKYGLYGVITDYPDLYQ